MPRLGSASFPGAGTGSGSSIQVQVIQESGAAFKPGLLSGFPLWRREPQQVFVFGEERSSAEPPVPVQGTRKRQHRAQTAESLVFCREEHSKDLASF